MFKKVSKPCAEYERMLSRWALVRVAVAGKEDIDDALLFGSSILVNPAYRLYAPRMTPDGRAVHGNADSVNARRLSYWRRARYMNATDRTLESLDGFIWSKKPELDLPQQLESLERDAVTMAKIATKEVLSVGRFGVLVDFDTIQNATLSQAEQAKPRLIYYKAEQIIYWRKDVEVRLLETYEQQKDAMRLEFEIKQQVRRIYINDAGNAAVVVYRDDDTQSDEIELIVAGKKLRELPFFFAGADSNSENPSKPPLYDLASENLGHYRLSADNLENLHYHGQGMTNIYTDMDADEFDEANPSGLDVGAGGRNRLMQGDRVEVLQIAATGAIPEEMGRVEARMVMLGAMLVMNQSANQTLGAKKIEFGAATSTLKRVAHNVSKAIESALKLAAVAVGANPDDVEFDLNSDFLSDDVTPQELQVLLASVQSGLLPNSIYWSQLRKKGITRLDDDEIKEELMTQSLGA